MATKKQKREKRKLNKKMQKAIVAKKREKKGDTIRVEPTKFLTMK